MVVGIDGKPYIADITQHAFGVEFAHIGVLCKYRVAFFECINVFATAKIKGIFNVYSKRTRDGKKRTKLAFSLRDSSSCVRPKGWNNKSSLGADGSIYCKRHRALDTPRIEQRRDQRGDTQFVPPLSV